jgi:hypothetical protein
VEPGTSDLSPSGEVRGPQSSEWDLDVHLASDAWEIRWNSALARDIELRIYDASGRVVHSMDAVESPVRLATATTTALATEHGPLFVSLTTDGGQSNSPLIALEGTETP